MWKRENVLNIHIRPLNKRYCSGFSTVFRTPFTISKQTYTKRQNGEEEAKELLKMFLSKILENRFFFILRFVWKRLAKFGIMLDSGKQKDYVHFGIIMRPTHINCIFCEEQRLRNQKKLAEKKEEEEEAEGKAWKLHLRLKD